MPKEPRIQLTLLRHADAGDPEAWTGPDDERPLSPKGRDQARRLGRHLHAAGYAVDLIVSSPLTRAVQTAEIVAGALGLTIVLEDRLADHVDAGVVRAILADHRWPSRPMLVGHDPSFSGTLAELTGANATMKKGALARIDLDADASESGVLRALLPPDLLASN